MSTQQGTERLELLQGTLDLLILRTLIFGAQHGQGIARAIQQTSDEELLVEHGALYPALQRLEERGWISARWGTSANNRKARFYSLTAAGPQTTRERNYQVESIGGSDRTHSGVRGGLAMFRHKRNASDFSAEIEAHIELETARLQEQGLSYEQARTAARRTFGNVTLSRERFYESGRWLGWDHFWHDIRYGARMLRKSPGFTAIAILTIALGIGATTAIFSVVDATLLHPLPYPQPEQLVSIEDDLPGVGAQDVGMSVPELHDFQRSGIFEYVSTIGGGDVNLTGSSQPERITFLNVNPNYFALLGVKPQLGHSFDPADQTPGFTLEAIISDGLWKRAFAADPGILGKSLRLDNDLYRVIGVMPRRLSRSGTHRGGTERRNVAGVGICRPACSAADAQRPLPSSIHRANQARADDGLGAEPGGRARGRVAETFSGGLSAAERMDGALVAAEGKSRRQCSPVADSAAVRGGIGSADWLREHREFPAGAPSARSREMAVRQALGAARSRLMSQLAIRLLFLRQLASCSHSGFSCST